MKGDGGEARNVKGAVVVKSLAKASESWDYKDDNKTDIVIYLFFFSDELFPVIYIIKNIK